MSPLCLFDLDGTLTADRTLLRLVEAFGVGHLLDLLPEGSGETRGGRQETERVLQGFTGVDADAFAAVCAAVRPRPGAEAAVRGLRARGFRIGVVTASYRPAAEAIQARLGLDFAVAVEPAVANGRLTGRQDGAGFEGDCGTFVCKARVLERFRIGGEPVVAVGDGRNDTCMFRAADLAVAMGSAPADVRSAADRVVDDLATLPDLIDRWMAHGRGKTWRGNDAERPRNVCGPARVAPSPPQ